MIKNTKTIIIIIIINHLAIVFVVLEIAIDQFLEANAVSTWCNFAH